MSVLGYSLDNLSLMALTLSVGFVVDDAIVVLENIVRHMEMGKKPYRAAIDGSAEIGFTILSMTVSLAAVFIPIVFMSGIVGRLLHEFAVTIVIAVLASGVVSVTLTPMLCARFLRDEHGLKQNAFHRASERAFLWLHGFYERTLQWSLVHKPVIVAMFAALSVVEAGELLLRPPHGNRLVTLSFEWGFGLYATLVLGLIGMVLGARFGGRVDDIDARELMPAALADLSPDESEERTLH